MISKTIYNRALSCPVNAVFSEYHSKKTRSSGKKKCVHTI
jgi:hypothetical protein